jgi:hypothetical protein
MKISKMETIPKRDEMKMRAVVMRVKEGLTT